MGDGRNVKFRDFPPNVRARCTRVQSMGIIDPEMRDAMPRLMDARATKSLGLIWRPPPDRAKRRVQQ